MGDIRKIQMSQNYAVLISR